MVAKHCLQGSPMQNCEIDPDDYFEVITKFAVGFRGCLI